MKRFVLASAVLGLVGAVGTASAGTVNSDNVTIWSAATPNANQFSASQQGLPTATGLFGGPLGLVAGSTAFTSPINYNDTTVNTIPGFFASGGAPTPATCLATCSSVTFSSGNFANATVFRFQFTTLTAELLTINHDDGISLFVKGTEDLTNSANLLPLSAASPTTASLTTIFIQPGVYDLWYAEVNGLPAVLQASAVPEPSTWAMMLLGFAGLGFAFRQSRRKVSFAWSKSDAKVKKAARWRPFSYSDLRSTAMPKKAKQRIAPTSKYSESLFMRVERGTLARVDNVLERFEARSHMLREAIEREIKRREHQQRDRWLHTQVASRVRCALDRTGACALARRISHQ
jgi:hypothetical protein